MTTTTTTATSSAGVIPTGASLAQQWKTLLVDNPKTRIRDAATKLGVTEAELLSTTVGNTAVRLDDDFAALLHALPSVGRCMALTRNESAVIEVTGTYDGIELGPHAGQVIGEAIDLRVFMQHWKYGFAVDEANPQKPEERRLSIHIFDASGTAVHKVYLRPESEGGNVVAWKQLVLDRARATNPPLELTPPASPRPTLTDEEVDVTALRADWDAMKDTHEFFFLLAKHKVARTQGLRLAGETRARRVEPSSLATLVEAASAASFKIMIFVGSRGCIEIFSGVTKKHLRTGPWFNVMDEGFNLHLREDHIAEAWVVSKPTATGVVSSLEVYDADGNNIALVFRKRDDREQAEDPTWSPLLEHLPSVSS